jgi:Na+/H+ antiporter NhaD/arsenite permease-like protein
MTLAQGLAFAIVIVMMALFAWGRWRYDLVAAVALVAAVIVGIVPPDQAFKGFSDDIVIIVGSALVVSAAVARSGVIERVARALGPYLVTIHRQIIALVGSVTLLSAFVKNVGALAMLMPIAFQLTRRTGTSPSSLLMPMSFGALLGGIVTLVGTRRTLSCPACANSCSARLSACSTSLPSAPVLLSPASLSRLRLATTSPPPQGCGLQGRCL